MKEQVYMIAIMIVAITNSEVNFEEIVKKPSIQQEEKVELGAFDGRPGVQLKYMLHIYYKNITIRLKACLSHILIEYTLCFIYNIRRKLCAVMYLFP